jgi:integrase
MPSLRRLSNSPYWTACITLPDGRRTNRSTKTTDRRIALRLANEWDRASKKARAGLLLQEQSRSVLNDILATIGGTPVTSETVDAFLKQWLAGKPEPTRKRYVAPVKHFLTFLGGSAVPLASIDYKTVLKFLDSRKAANIAPKTLELEARTLCAAFNLAQKLGLIIANPFARALALQPVRSESKIRECFEPDEITKLVQTATGDWRTMILLGYYTGARLADCANMTWRNVDIANQIISFEPQKIRRRNKRVVVPIHRTLLMHLQDIVSTEEPVLFLCPRLAGRNVGGKNGLSSQFARIVKKSGVDSITSEGNGMLGRSFHSLRHSFCSALANGGVAQETRMQLAGHSSVKINTDYTHLGISHLRSAVAKLPMVGGVA